MHGDLKGGRSVGTRNAVLGLHDLSVFFFETFDERTSDECRAFDHPGDGLVDFRFDREILQMKVGKRNRHRKISY